MSFESERAISYIEELERKVQRLTETSTQYRINELERGIVALETKLKIQIEENRRLQLKVAELGMDLGRALNVEASKG